MSTEPGIVIVGAGQAGGDVATGLRRLVIGRPAEFNAARKLVSSRAEVDAALLGDAAVPLASITA